MTRALIFGIDGADYHLTRDLMDSGVLPNLKSLRERGSYHPLQSTIPPLTPQAWSSFACGVNPGKHGIFDFGEVPYDSYESKLNTSEDRKTKGFWEYLAKAGLSSAILNMPLTYPAEEIPGGYMLSGMHTPDARDLCANPEVQDFIDREFPNFQVDVMSFWYKDMDHFVELVKDMVRERTRLSKELIRRFPVDVFFQVWVGLDRVLHAFYSQQDFVVGNRGWKYQGVVRDIFRIIDEGVGELIHLVPSDTPIMILSDHGFGDLKKDVYLNNFFLDRGYLDFNPEILSKRMFDHPNWAGGRFLNSLYKLKMKFRMFRKGAPWQQKSFDALDFSRLKAFSTGLFGNVFLHRKGRFPHGYLDPGSEEYEEILASVLDDLYSLRVEGKRLVDQAYLSREIYHGPFVEKAPDIILKMRDYSYITRGGSEFHSNELFSDPEVNHSGNHRMEGIFFLSGPQFEKGVQLPVDPLLEDLSPTLLHFLGLPVPKELDGRVLMRLIKEKSEVIYSDENIYRETKVSKNLGDESMEKRLQALGYM